MTPAASNSKATGEKSQVAFLFNVAVIRRPKSAVPTPLFWAVVRMLSPVENGGAGRGKMAARGMGGVKGWALGEPGNGIDWGQRAA